MCVGRRRPPSRGPGRDPLAVVADVAEQSAGDRVPRWCVWTAPPQGGDDVVPGYRRYGPRPCRGPWSPQGASPGRPGDGPLCTGREEVSAEPSAAAPPSGGRPLRRTERVGRKPVAESESGGGLPEPTAGVSRPDRPPPGRCPPGLKASLLGPGAACSIGGRPSTSSARSRSFSSFFFFGAGTATDAA